MPFKHPAWCLLAAGAFAAGAFAAVVITGCVPPAPTARTAADYERKAEHTAEAILSAVQTARLGIDAIERDRAFPAYVSVVASEAESDAGSAASTFRSIQPPGSRSDALRAELGRLAQDATDALGQLRIAARRADADGAVAAAARLDAVGADLESFIAEHA